jgi:serpin B
MMHKTDAYRYAENDDWQCLAMTYKPANIRGEMVVLLPRSGKELTKLESTLSLESLDRLLGGLRPQRVAVTMPKLKLQTKYDLKTPLRNMGMNLAFDAIDADFRGISSGEGLYITDVVHQAFLEMNEERTEAAAATGVVMAPRGLPAKTDRPVVFKADRPFLFLIRDARTGLIFFLGRFADPRQSS